MSPINLMINLKKRCMRNIEKIISPFIISVFSEHVLERKWATMVDEDVGWLRVLTVC
jgi:acyl carrier protein phosphodiesterase